MPTLRGRVEHLQHQGMIRLTRRRALATVAGAIAGLGWGYRSSAQARLSNAGSTGAARSLPAQAPIRLSLNENPYGPAPGVVEAITHDFPNLCRYTGSEFNDLLDAIATHESVPREQVVLGEILEPLGTRLSLDGGPGGEFVYSDPGYTALIDTAAAVGGRAIAVPLNAKLENDLAAIAAKVNERTRAVYLVNPHNPTGIVSAADAFRDFARSLSKRTLVIVDEAYLEYADDFAARTLSDLVRAGENIIVFRTLAKMYGLAGLEIGYGLLPDKLAATLIAQGANDPHLFNRLAVTAATASLRAVDYVPRVRTAVTAQREDWFRLLRELHVRHTASTANFIFMQTGSPNAQFAAAMLEHGVVIGRAFPPYDDWARISIGLPAENARAQAAVRKILG
jgi:histidinol-phosphate aminotransferase